MCKYFIIIIKYFTDFSEHSDSSLHRYLYLKYSFINPSKQFKFGALKKKSNKNNMIINGAFNR